MLMDEDVCVPLFREPPMIFVKAWHQLPDAFVPPLLLLLAFLVWWLVG